uniref:Uncharacterized protein n=2 Tax=Chrysotila carterae TaxID=13221 RepID=A0A7S4BWJ0_CHRCT
MDVATFMCGSLRVDARRLLDMDMLMEYHATLLAHGISGYTFEALVSDYRLALLLCLVMPVLSSPDWLRLHTAGLLHRGSTIGERFELACAVVHRITSAVADLHNGGIAK